MNVKRAALCLTAVLVMTRVAIIFAQAPDFSGTWKLDTTRSRITATAGLAGLIQAGAPQTLHITQPANGTVIIESQINESHSRIYRPGGKSSTPIWGGGITVTSRWEGRTLVSEGNRESAAGPATVKEIIALGADGRTLSIDVTATAAGEQSASTLIYTKTQGVEPCQNWPTPCKYPARPK